MEHKIDAKEMTLRMVSEGIKEAVEKGNPVVVTNAEHIHCLASGLKGGNIIVRGNVGDYVASLNAGATIAIEGKAGNFIADNMTKGEVIVNHDVGRGAGQYCYGGLLVVRGSAGDFSATMNKGATAIIIGNIGDDACTYMVAGDVVILGDAGKNLANYLIGGNVYIGGDWASLGHNTKVVEMEPEDLVKLDTYFKEYNIEADPRKLRKIIPETDKPFYAKREKEA